MDDFFLIWCQDNHVNPGRAGSKAWQRALTRYNGTGMDSYEGLTEIAELLGGQVDAQYRDLVNCPAPGAHPIDRSLTIRIDPSRPRDFYVYFCPQAVAGEAEAHIRELLGLSEVEPEAEIAERIARALKVWEEAQPAAGTIVETYLRSRRLPLPPLPVIRFAPKRWHADARDHWPAMVALFTDAHDRPTGVHLTYLRPDGSGKAPLAKLDQRRTMGLIKGSAIRLAGGDGRLLVGEGIETVLSVHVKTGRPAWASGGANNLPPLRLPDSISAVTALVDGDKAGRESCVEAASNWGKEGRSVTLAEAPDGTDFNDLLVEEAHG